MKQQIRRLPLLGPTLARAARAVRARTFPGSAQYWERHYADGGNSGDGSSGRLARAKAEVLNEFVSNNGIQSVIEFGCGDGQQLAMARYPTYLGLDVSSTVLRRTSALFTADRTKSFMHYDPTGFVDTTGWLTADLALSLDVIYHLVEDETYETHLRHVFAASRRFVILYTSDADSLTILERMAPQVRHRPVVRDIEQRFTEWELDERITNQYPYKGTETDTSFADFFVYRHREPLATPLDIAPSTATLEPFGHQRRSTAAS